MKTILTSLLVVLISLNAFATDTKIMVRAKARDAKFVGSSLGGAYVQITNVKNGQLLAEGLTSGSTGNTSLIMKTPHERYTSIADDTTAGFLATIAIEAPTFVRIEVRSPYQYKNAQVQASTELWLLPGKHILGDGIVLEIPGFIVDILKPTTHQYIPLSSLENNQLEVKANIVMMCGCVIDKGGLWDSEDIEVTGLLKRNGDPYKEVRLTHSSRNTFETSIPMTEQGQYELTVYAYNAKSGNTGVDVMHYILVN